MGDAFLLQVFLIAVFAVSGTVYAQTPSEKSPTDPANTQCPKADASYGYRSDLAYKALYKEGVQQKTNLYGKDCVDKAQSSGTLTAIGTCRAAEVCHAVAYRDLDGKIKKITDIDAQISKAVQQDIVPPTGEAITKDLLKSDTSKAPALPTNQTVGPGITTNWNGQNDPIDTMPTAHSPSDEYNFNKYLSGLAGSDSTGKDAPDGPASFDSRFLDSAPQTKLQDASGGFDQNDPTLSNSYGYATDQPVDPAKNPVTGFNNTSPVDPANSATGFDTAPQSCDGFWCTTKEKISSAWDYVKSGDYLGFSSAEAKPSSTDSASGDQVIGSHTFEVTAYYPCAANNCAMEGGLASSVKGPDGTALVRTLDDYRLNKSDYVTGAADASRYGQSYILPEITYRSALDGKEYTLSDVPVSIHDTGGAFANNPDKLDIAAGISNSDADAARLAQGQPFLENRYQTLPQVSAVPANNGIDPVSSAPPIVNLGSDASSPLAGGAIDSRSNLSPDIVPSAQNPRIAESAFGPTADSVRDINFSAYSPLHAVEKGGDLADITPNYNSLIPTPEWTPRTGEEMTADIQNTVNQEGEAAQLADRYAQADADAAHLAQLQIDQQSAYNDRLAQADAESNAYVDQALKDFPVAPSASLSGEEITAQVNREINAQYPAPDTIPGAYDLPTQKTAWADLLNTSGQNTAGDYSAFYDSTNAAPKSIDEQLPAFTWEPPTGEEITAQFQRENDADQARLAQLQLDQQSAYNDRLAQADEETAAYQKEQAETNARVDKALADFPAPAAPPTEEEITADIQNQNNAELAREQAALMQKNDQTQADFDQASCSNGFNCSAVQNTLAKRVDNLQKQITQAQNEIEQYKNGGGPVLVGADGNTVLSPEESIILTQSRLDDLQTRAAQSAKDLSIVQSGSTYGLSSDAKNAAVLASQGQGNTSYYLDKTSSLSHDLGASLFTLSADDEKKAEALKSWARENCGSVCVGALYVNDAVPVVGLATRAATDLVISPISTGVNSLGAFFNEKTGGWGSTFNPGADKSADCSINGCSTERAIDVGNAALAVYGGPALVKTAIGETKAVVGGISDYFTGARTAEAGAGAADTIASNSTQLDRLYTAQNSASDALETSIARGASPSEIAGNRIQLENVNAAIERVQGAPTGVTPGISTGAVVADEIVVAETNAALDAGSASRSGQANTPNNTAVGPTGANVPVSTRVAGTDDVFGTAGTNARNDLATVPDAARGTGTDGLSANVPSTLKSSAPLPPQGFYDGSLHINITPGRSLSESGANTGVTTIIDDAATARTSVPSIAPELDAIAPARTAVNETLPPVVQDAVPPRTSVPSIAQTRDIPIETSPVDVSPSISANAGVAETSMPAVQTPEFQSSPSFYEQIVSPVQDWFDTNFFSSNRNIVQDIRTDISPNQNVQFVQPPAYPAFTPSQTNGTLGNRIAAVSEGPTTPSLADSIAEQRPIGSAINSPLEAAEQQSQIRSILDQLANEKPTSIPEAPEIAANASDRIGASGFPSSANPSADLNIAPSLSSRPVSAIQPKSTFSTLWDNTIGKVLGSDSSVVNNAAIEPAATIERGAEITNNVTGFSGGEESSLQLAIEPTEVPRIDIAADAHPGLVVSTEVPPQGAVEVLVNDSFGSASIRTSDDAARNALNNSTSATGNQIQVYMSAKDAAALAQNPAAEVTVYPIPRAPLATEVKVGAADSIQSIFQAEAEKQGFFGGIKEKITSFFDNFKSTANIGDDARIEPALTRESPVVGSGAKAPEIPGQTRGDIAVSENAPKADIVPGEQKTITLADEPQIENPAAGDTISTVPAAPHVVVPAAESKTWTQSVKEFFGFGKSEPRLPLAEQQGTGVLADSVQMPRQPEGQFIDFVDAQGNVSVGQSDIIRQQVYANNPEFRAIDDVQAMIKSGKSLTPAEAEQFARQIGNSIEERYGVKFAFVEADPVTGLSKTPLPRDTGLTPLLRDSNRNVISRAGESNYGSWSPSENTVYFYRDLFENPKELLPELRHEAGAVLIDDAIGGGATKTIPGIRDASIATTHDLDSFTSPLAGETRAAADRMLVNAGIADDAVIARDAAAQAVAPAAAKGTAQPIFTPTAARAADATEGSVVGSVAQTAADAAKATAKFCVSGIRRIAGCSIAGVIAYNFVPNPFTGWGTNTSAGSNGSTAPSAVSPATAAKVNTPPAGGLQPLTVDGVRKAVEGKQPVAPSNPAPLNAGAGQQIHLNNPDGSILGAIGSFFGGLFSGLRSGTATQNTGAAPTPVSGVNGTNTATTSAITPSVSFISNPTSITAGNAVRLSWAAVGSNTCSITTLDNSVITTGSYQGSFTTQALSTSTVFSIACFGGTGTSTAQASVTVK